MKQDYCLPRYFKSKFEEYVVKHCIENKDRYLTALLWDRLWIIEFYKNLD